MNEFNVLLNAATNGAPSGSLFDALFARYIAPQESWRELESPLPITILAAGEDLIDYRIYGNTENGESVGERTENLIDANKPNVQQRVEVEPGEKYCLSKYQQRGATGRPSYAIYDENDNQIQADYIAVWMSISFTAPDNGKYVLITFGSAYVGLVSFVIGETKDNYTPYPDQYIPYGYKLPMVVTNGTTTTTTPIYIGSNPLAEDEYVDFGEQKIYRKVNGILTPTDPPVPIPALPTIEGETIIDYNPSETPAVEPEKMYIKYKPQ